MQKGPAFGPSFDFPVLVGVPTMTKRAWRSSNNANLLEATVCFTNEKDDEARDRMGLHTLVALCVGDLLFKKPRLVGMRVRPTRGPLIPVRQERAREAAVA
jgi:hypothetical protein